MNKILINYFLQTNFMGKFFKVRDSDWTQNFRIVNLQDSSELGVCYQQTKQVWISLHRHESIQNIIDTVNHETLHQALRSDVIKKNEHDDEMDMTRFMDTEQEHELIKRVIWLVNDWVDFSDQS